MTELIQNLKEIIDTADRMRGSYWFTPPSSAGGRRSYERQYNKPEICWEEGGHTYTASFSVSCSCRNVYASGNYTKDGGKCNLLTVKNSYRRLLIAAGEGE